MSRPSHLETDGRTVLALAGVEAVANGRNRVFIRCPSGTHSDDRPSASVRLDTGAACCFSCGWTARGTIELHAALNNFQSARDAAVDLRRRCDGPVPALRIVKARTKHSTDRRTSSEGRPIAVARWVYREADGSPAFEVQRVQFKSADGAWVKKPGGAKPRKTFRQCHPGGAPPCLPDQYRAGNRPLYRLPELIAAPSRERLFIVEGEKAADALVARGLCAATSAGGASHPHMTHWTPLVGREMVLWPDNDEAGANWFRSAQEVLNALKREQAQ